MKLEVTLLLVHSQGPAPWQRMVPHWRSHQKDHLNPEGQTSCYVKCRSCKQIQEHRYNFIKTYNCKIFILYQKLYVWQNTSIYTEGGHISVI